MRARRLIGFVSFTVGMLTVSACSLSTAAAGQPAAVEVDCNTYQRSNYRELYQADAFQSDGAVANPVPLAVQALRCMMQEPNARAWIQDLQARGSMPGQLYALVALSALDPDVFRTVSKQYLTNEERVRLSGVDVLTYLSVSDAVTAIGRGRYVQRFLPELAMHSPPQGVEVERPR